MKKQETNSMQIVSKTHRKFRRAAKLKGRKLGEFATEVLDERATEILSAPKTGK